MLSARTGGAEGVDAQILRVNFQFDLFSLRHDSHRHGRGVDTPLRLGLRHALDAVNAALKFQAAVYAGAFH